MFQYEPNRIFQLNENGELIAEVTFPSRDTSSVVINHTFVDDSLRGQGIAGKLMQAVGNQVRSQGKFLYCTCPYAVKWFNSHQEFKDIYRV